MPQSDVCITAIYHFTPQTDEEVAQRRQQLFAIGEEIDLKGLVIMGCEGINGTVAGTSETIATFKETLEKWYGKLDWKDSSASENPFKRWFVKVRDEIVSLGNTDICPENGDHHHLTPQQWHDVLESGEDVVVLDTRNDYETEVGIFKNAIDPKLGQFNEFPQYVAQCDIPKDKKVLMYCTGGIRCEKALLEMERQGYTNVYQLQGGILKYLEEYPHKHFDGECFVFDHRTAVNQELKPSETYGLCPLSGDPADEWITCRRCGEETRVHKRIAKDNRHFCSKNCEYQFNLKSKRKAVNVSTVAQHQ